MTMSECQWAEPSDGASNRRFAADCGISARKPPVLSVRSKPHALHKSLARPSAVLALTLAASLIVACVPRRAIEPFARGFTTALAPACIAADYVRERLARCRAAAGNAEDVAQLEAELRLLRARARELEAALASALARSDASEITTSGKETAPLLVTHGVRARVLGARATALLGESQLIGIARGAPPARDTLVLADSALAIDAGNDARITHGDLALVGRRVYGKVVDVGSRTATVRRADQPGYRDVVQLSRLIDGRFTPGPKGVLEGAGGGTCRVRMVSAHERVEPGDLVLTAQDEGLLPEPLVYGTVSRAERRDAAPHWDISVELPDSAAGQRHLIVLCTTLNRERLAAMPGGNTALKVTSWQESSTEKPK
jgi:cell shape-determining protein MreC